MRTRSRASSTSPWYNGSLSPIETIEDEEPSLSRGWKPCGHSRFSVKQLVPLTVSVGWYNTYTKHEDWGEPEVNAKYMPNGMFNNYFSGPYRDSLIEAPSLTFAKIDPSSVALEISRSSTNLAEALATMKDTCKMLARPGAFLKHVTNRRDIVYTERTPIAELKAAIDRAGKTWLEGTYGYLPLISDLIELRSIVTNPRKSLDKLKKPIKKDIRETVSGAGSYAKATFDGRQLGPYMLRCAISSQHVASRLVRVQGEPNPTFQAMGLANQMATYLGLNDFGRLAWELVPYSFVVDWFTGMGRTVASASALNGHLAYCDVRFSTAIRQSVITSYSVMPPARSTINDWPYIGKIRMSGGSLVTESIKYSRSREGEGNLNGDLVFNGLNAYRTTSGASLLLGSLGKLARW